MEHETPKNVSCFFFWDKAEAAFSGAFFESLLAGRATCPMKTLYDGQMSPRTHSLHLGDRALQIRRP
jgi:hypothetical protein